jgi:hypothetical protein
MIDILYNKLGALNAGALTEWNDVSTEIFNRHSQYPQYPRYPRYPKEIEKQSQQSQRIPAKEITNTKKPDVPCASETLVAPAKKTPVKPVKPASQTIKPLDIIMNETMCFHNSADYIKEAIITLITKEEFSKIFGMTKCAEIMSGIVNNRWNKSTALFISFFLDKEVLYNDKVILYNKDKNKGRITI